MMQTVTLTGGSLSMVKAALELFTARPLPHELSKRFRRVMAQVNEHLEPWLVEIQPFVDKHTAPGESMTSAHHEFGAFYADARELIEREIELEIEPITDRELDAAAAVMQRRADRGIGDPLVWSVAESEILWTVGILKANGGT